MNLTYEYRLFPRKSEAQALDKLLEQGREVYNWALAQCKTSYETSGKRATGLGQGTYFRQWRKQPGILLNASSLQQLWRRLDKSYSAFFRRIKAGETPGQPRFNSMEYTYGDMGLLRLLTLSDDTLIDNPRWLRQTLSELRTAQRRLRRHRACQRHRLRRRSAPFSSLHRCRRASPRRRLRRR